jgi:hypothetical protein
MPYRGLFSARGDRLASASLMDSLLVGSAEAGTAIMVANDGVASTRASVRHRSSRLSPPYRTERAIEMSSR